LNISFPYEYNLNQNNKKEEKLKIKLVKKEFTNVIGTAEILLTNFSTLKSKKNQVSKKWYNINSNMQPNYQKESSSFTKRGINSANFALNLINTIKVHFKITEIFMKNESVNSSNANIETEDLNNKYYSNNLHSKSNSFSVNLNNKSIDGNGSSLKNAVNINNSITTNNLHCKNKSVFEEIKDLKESFDYNSNNDKKNSRNNNVNGNLSVHNNLSINNNKIINEGKTNCNGKEHNNAKGLNNLKENTAILEKPNYSNNLKKNILDCSLSQSLNSSNFQIIKNSLNNSVIGSKLEEKKNGKIFDLDSDKNREIRDKDKSSGKVNISQNNLNSNNLKKKNISMIDNSKGLPKFSNSNKISESPRSNLVSGKLKEINNNMFGIKSTTNQNSVTFNYNGLFYLILFYK